MKTNIRIVFRRLTRSTLVAVFFLVLVGGVVRSSGSGMGCPDWPKCFGHWVPPREISQLPSDYQLTYDAYRQKKNERYARLLDLVGFHDTAAQLRTVPAQRSDEEFNAYKTWTEYFNRLIGVIVGLLIMAVAITSLKFRKSNVKLTVLAFVALLTVIFQGWLGAVVVSTNLTPWVVTVHMVLALVLIGLLGMLLELETETVAAQPQRGMVFLVSICTLFLVLQILFGTAVREEIDRLSQDGLPRQGWIAGLGSVFLRHRSFSWAVLITDLVLIVRLWKSASLDALPRAIIILVFGSMLTGMAMAYWGVPAGLQPVHLLFATLLFGLQFMLLVRWGRRSLLKVNPAAS